MAVQPWWPPIVPIPSQWKPAPYVVRSPTIADRFSFKHAGRLTSAFAPFVTASLRMLRSQWLKSVTLTRTPGMKNNQLSLCTFSVVTCHAHSSKLVDVRSCFRETTLTLETIKANTAAVASAGFAVVCRPRPLHEL